MAKKMELTLVGMFHRLTPSTVRKIAEELEGVNLKCRLEREPGNSHDALAVKVIVVEQPWAKGPKPNEGLQIGYVKRESASVIAPVMDSGEWDFTEVTLISVDAQRGIGELVLRRKA